MALEGGETPGKSLNHAISARSHRRRLFQYLANRNRTTYDSHGQVYNLAKNHTPFLYRLDQMKKLPVHDGCVNTICWNKTGEYILSGSDDSNLCITKPNYLFDNTKDYTVLHKVQTRHLGNIFSAQFMPNSSDCMLVSCSSEGPVIVHDINSETPSLGIYTYNCHSSVVFEVAVLPDNDNVFLSCGKDKTVRLFDLRCHKSCARAGTCPHPALIRNSHAITTLSVHPLNSNLLLLGRADSTGLVYDRRKLPDVTKFSRERAHQEYLDHLGRERRSASTSTCDMFKYSHPLDGVVSQFTVPTLDEKCQFTSLCYSSDGQQVLASYSQDYVYLFNVDKSSNFELVKTLPRRSSSDNNNNNPVTITTSRNSPDISLNPPRRPTRGTRRPRIRVRGDWSDTGINSVPYSSRTNDRSEQNASNFLQRMADMAYSSPSGGGDRFLPLTEIIAPGPLEYYNSTDDINQSESPEDQSNQEELMDDEGDDDQSVDIEINHDDDDDEFDDDDFSGDEIVPTTLRVDPTSQSHSTDCSESTNTSTKKSKEKPKVSEKTKLKFQNLRNNLRNKYSNIPTYHPRVCYQGHRNSRTLIKEAVFWGDDYIMSGSDCGRIMIWEKETANLVMSFPADNRVVNCLAPNPYHYALASSGIDYDIKIWSTQNIKEGPLKIGQSEMDEIVKNNELMLEEAKQTIIVPPHLFFRVLASFSPNRRI